MCTWSVLDTTRHSDAAIRCLKGMYDGGVVQAVGWGVVLILHWSCDTTKMLCFPYHFDERL